MESDKTDDPRRRLLINALAAGAFSALPGSAALAEGLFGTVPTKMKAGRSIFRIVGKATVNGKEATLDTPIGPNDVIATGKDSEIVFVVGGHAMILRANGLLDLKGEKKEETGSFFLSGLRMLTGKLLSVSRNQPMSVRTSTATIGIRGTGLYIEADPELTYFCTCYGTTDVASTDDPSSTDTVVATHHDKPLYITSKGSSGKNIQRAGFKSHSDQELMLIETLVGRSPPFVFPGTSYDAPRKSY